jgi:hypothetical protein
MAHLKARRPVTRRTALFIVAGAFAASAVLGGAAPTSAAPPTPPPAATARTELATLQVAAPYPMTGYSRDKFPHWVNQHGACNTREVVLQRDGESVTTDSDCAAVSGRWYSVYDQVWLTSAADVDIDHVVPLANAWRSGADWWPTSQREAFANDLDSQQLIAVHDTVNQAKGDQSPDQWKPPNTGYWCVYARSWVHVKYVWKLTITSAEKAALTDMLDRC